MSLIALDLDGTLVDQVSAARVWAREFVEQRGLPDTEVDAITAALSARRPKNEVFSQLVDRLSLPTAPDDIWRDYRTRMPALVTMNEADRGALVDLRSAGWTLGIVTNGMADNQESKIRRSGLADLVDGWVISDAVGHRKPTPEIFYALAEKLGCPLRGWMIGDSLELDVAGGAAVGLRTAWIDDDRSDPTPFGPDLVVGSVAGAAALLHGATADDS